MVGNKDDIINKIISNSIFCFLVGILLYKIFKNGIKRNKPIYISTYHP